MEEEQNGGGLKHQLIGVSISLLLIQSSTSYRLEGILSIDKVKGAEEQPALRILVALHPALAQKIPFRLEFSAQHASKSCLEGCEQYCDRVVPRCFCQLRVCGIIERERAGRGFGPEVIEAVA